MPLSCRAFDVLRAALSDESILDTLRLSRIGEKCDY